MPLRPALRASNPVPSDEALAHRVASSSARFVILLERHDMTFRDCIFFGKPRSIIINGNRSKHFDEYPADISRMLLVGERRGVVYNKTDAFNKVLAQNDSIFSAVPIGHDLVAIRDGLANLTFSNEQEKLFRDFFIAPKRRGLKRAFGRNVTDEFVVYSLWMDIVKSEKMLFLELSNRLLAGNMKQVVERYQKETGKDFGSLVEELTKVFGVFEDAILEQRIYGQSDEAAVKAMFKTIRQNEQVTVKFGIEHGIISGNPASLPDQIKLQAQALNQDASCDIIMLVCPQFASHTHETIAGHVKLGKLRADVRVGILRCSKNGL